MAFNELIPWWHGRREPARRPETARHPETARRLETARHPETENPVAAFQRDMDRAMEQFRQVFERLPSGGFGMPAAFPFQGGLPRADVRETDKAVEVAVELPGFDEKDIDVSIAQGLLTVKAEHKTEREEEEKEAGWYLRERSVGEVRRTLTLPPTVDTDKAEASFRNGVLSVTLPKTGEADAGARRIAVNKG